MPSSTTMYVCPRCNADTPASPCTACGGAFDIGQPVTDYVIEANATAPTGEQVTPGGYQIHQLLATGGMGMVLTGQHLASKNPVILKAPKDRSEHAQARFDREARALATCNHPNIVSLVDIDATNGGWPLLILEHISGVDLARLLHRGPLPWFLLHRVAYDIIGALDHIHRRGIIHRDVKPANILVGKKRAVLIDFGIAQVERSPLITGANRLTPAGSILGSPPFCAPEQLIDPRRAGPPADIYSFGMIIKHSLDDSLRNTPLFQGWSVIVDQCCKERPEHRPTSLQLMEQIRALPVQPAVIDSPTKNNKTWSIPKGLLGSIAGAALAILAVAFGVTSTHQDPPLVFQGNIGTDGNVVFKLPANTSMIIEPLGNTQFRISETDAWRQKPTRVTSTNDGELHLQLKDSDGDWSLHMYK